MTPYEACKEHVVSSAARNGYQLDAAALEHILCQAERRGLKLPKGELADLLQRYGMKVEVKVEPPAPVSVAQPSSPEPIPVAQPLPPTPAERVKAAVRKAVRRNKK